MLEVLVSYVVAPDSSVPRPPRSTLDGIPEGDGSAQDVQAAGPVHLVLVGAVTHLPEAVEEDGPGECIPCLSLVEAAGNAAS